VSTSLRQPTLLFVNDQGPSSPTIVIINHHGRRQRTIVVITAPIIYSCHQSAIARNNQEGYDTMLLTRFDYSTILPVQHATINNNATILFTRLDYPPLRS
jgi:hypothetical protein